MINNFLKINSRNIFYQPKRNEALSALSLYINRKGNETRHDTSRSRTGANEGWFYSVRVTLNLRRIVRTPLIFHLHPSYGTRIYGNRQCTILACTSDCPPSISSQRRDAHISTLRISPCVYIYLSFSPSFYFFFIFTVFCIYACGYTLTHSCFSFSRVFFTTRFMASMRTRGLRIFLRYSLLVNIYIDIL